MGFPRFGPPGYRFRAISDDSQYCISPPHAPTDYGSAGHGYSKLHAEEVKQKPLRAGFESQVGVTDISGAGSTEIGLL